MRAQKIWRHIARRMADLDIDDALHTIRLERRRSAAALIAPMLGMLAAGLVVGTGVGLMCAPSSGRLLRKNVENRFSQLREKIHTGEMKNAIVDHLNAPSTG